jgi:hypothetical protein
MNAMHIANEFTSITFGIEKLHESLPGELNS